MSPVRALYPLCALFLLVAAVLASHQAGAQPVSGPDAGPDWRDMNRVVVDGHIIPRYQALAQAMQALDAQIGALCGSPTEANLALVRGGFGIALDAWNGISHIRFGPVETEQRYFRFQLWPDKRGTGQRQVRQLLADQDRARLDPAVFARDSVAVQGLSALEMLLFPEEEVGVADFAAEGGPSYRCHFAQAIGDNLAGMSGATLADWTQGDQPYRRTLLEPAPAQGVPGGPATPGVAPSAGAGAGRFSDDQAVSAELLKTLNTGAQVIHELKLPLPAVPATGGTGPRKGEAWRSRRSLGNVCTNLRALEHLYATGFALRLRASPEAAEVDQGVALTLAAAVSACLSLPAAALDEPLGAEVVSEQAPGQAPEEAPGETPERAVQRRKALEDLRDLAGALQARTGRPLAEQLGLLVGFNSLDGD